MCEFSESYTILAIGIEIIRYLQTSRVVPFVLKVYLATVNSFTVKLHQKKFIYHKNKAALK